jgi:hypothetical protein
VAEGWTDELIAHLGRTSRLSRPEAEWLVQEVVAFFSESLEDFVARRHREFQERGLRNDAIYARISEESPSAASPRPRCPRDRSGGSLYR